MSKTRTTQEAREIISTRIEQAKAALTNITPLPWREGTGNVWQDDILRCVVEAGRERSYGKSKKSDSREVKQDDCRFISLAANSLPAAILAWEALLKRDCVCPFPLHPSCPTCTALLAVAQALEPQ